MVISNSTLFMLTSSANSWGVSTTTLLTTFNLWVSVSNFTEAELLSYAELYYVALQWWSNMFWWRIVSLIAFAVFGLVGYAAEIIVLRQKEFDTPSFLYHKSIVGFEAVFCIAIIIDYSLNLNPDSSSTMTYVIDTLAAIENICGMTVEWLALAVSLERLTAMFLPSKFPVINKNKVAKIGIAVCFFIGFFHYSTRPWDSDLTPFQWYANFRVYFLNLQMVECFSLAVFSALIAVGIVRQMRLSAQKQLNGDAKAASSLSVQISMLSMSVSIPPFLETLLFVISQNICYNGACTKGTAAVTNNTYAAAVLQLNMYILGRKFSWWSYIFWGLAHSDHFYVYAILSPRFREAVIRRFHLSKYVSVSPVISLQGGTSFK